jgi:thiamine pyrophosphokinase
VARTLNRAFLLADGAPLPRRVRDRLRRGAITVAIDGAAEIARKEGWRPDFIIGDFDSVRRTTLAHFSRLGVEILRTPDQDYTDLEKALAWVATLGDLRTITVAQGAGSRLDHSLGNLSLLKRFHSPRRELTFYTETERVRYAEDETLRLKGRSGRRIAVIPFPAARVSSRGLRFEMKALDLALGVRESISNAARRADVALDIKGGALVIEEYRRE